jgi:hypothetical protein
VWVLLGSQQILSSMEWFKVSLNYRVTCSCGSSVELLGCNAVCFTSRYQCFTAEVLKINAVCSAKYCYLLTNPHGVTAQTTNTALRSCILATLHLDMNEAGEGVLWITIWSLQKAVDTNRFVRTEIRCRAVQAWDNRNRLLLYWTHYSGGTFCLLSHLKDWELTPPAPVSLKASLHLHTSLCLTSLESFSRFTCGVSMPLIIHVIKMLRAGCLDFRSFVKECHDILVCEGRIYFSVAVRSYVITCLLQTIFRPKSLPTNGAKPFLWCPLEWELR